MHLPHMTECTMVPSVPTIRSGSLVPCSFSQITSSITQSPASNYDSNSRRPATWLDRVVQSRFIIWLVKPWSTESIYKSKSYINHVGVAARNVHRPRSVEKRFKFGLSFYLASFVQDFHPRFLSVYASTWLLPDTLQHSILSLWLRAIQAVVPPACLQNSSRTQVHALVRGHQCAANPMFRFLQNRIVSVSASTRYCSAVTSLPSFSMDSNRSSSES